MARTLLERSGLPARVYGQQASAAGEDMAAASDGHVIGSIMSKSGETDLPELLAPQKIELLIRIVLQNVILLLAVTAFAGLAVAALAWPGSGWVVACVHAIVSGALLLQWCHHGVRTMQLKAFLLRHEGQEPSGWEVWLPANRPKRLLGTRWFISTKGVFLGTQAAMAGLAALTAAAAPGWAPAACFLAFAVSTGLLLTNPKE